MTASETTEQRLRRRIHELAEETRTLRKAVRESQERYWRARCDRNYQWRRAEMWRVRATGKTRGRP